MAAAVILLFVGLALVPAAHRVTGQARLEGRVHRALVAGAEGFLSEAHARPGDVVREGDVLARIDERDLRLTHLESDSERAQLEKRYREAFASGDRAEVSLLRARLEQARAQLALAEDRLQRAAVVAPFDGVVLDGDLHSALGSPIELGRVLFEIAPLDGYRTVVEVSGRDIAHILPGQQGRLALEALPGESFPLVVERVTPLSMSEDGRSFFRVEAALETVAPVLRPGMEGVAKIEVGQRPLLWIWMHPLIDWLRLSLWSFVP